MIGRGLGNACSVANNDDPRQTALRRFGKRPDRSWRDSTRHGGPKMSRSNAIEIQSRRVDSRVRPDQRGNQLDKPAGGA